MRSNDSSGKLPTKLSDRGLFSDAIASLERVWTLRVLLTDSHQPVLTVKSTRRDATNTKTDVVVTIIARVVVEISRTAIHGIVVPGTAAQQLYCPPQI